MFDGLSAAETVMVLVVQSEVLSIDMVIDEKAANAEAPLSNSLEAAEPLVLILESNVELEETAGFYVFHSEKALNRVHVVTYEYVAVSVCTEEPLCLKQGNSLIKQSTEFIHAYQAHPKVSSKKLSLVHLIGILCHSICKCTNTNDLQNRPYDC